jgi:hypothetical protein
MIIKVILEAAIMRISFLFLLLAAPLFSTTLIGFPTRKSTALELLCILAAITGGVWYGASGIRPAQDPTYFHAVRQSETACSCFTDLAR